MTLQLLCILLLEKLNYTTLNKIISARKKTSCVMNYGNKYFLFEKLEAAEDDAESRSKIMNCGLSDDMIGLGKSPKKKLDKQGEEGNGELDLTGIDDDEINQVLLAKCIFVVFKRFVCWCETKTYCFVGTCFLE